MKISISIPEELYKDIVETAKENERTISGEVIYRMKVGTRERTEQIVSTTSGKKWIPNKDWSFLRNYEGVTGQESNVVSKAVEPTSNYEEVIKAIESTLDRDVDYEERQKLSQLVKESGLVFNAYKKTLEKLEPNGRYKIIHQF